MMNTFQGLLYINEKYLHEAKLNDLHRLEKY